MDTKRKVSIIQKHVRERYQAVLKWHKITHEYFTRHLTEDDRNVLSMCFQGRLNLYSGLVPDTNASLISLTPSDATFVLHVMRLLSIAPKVPQRMAVSRYVNMSNQPPPKVGSTLPHMLPYATTLREGFAVFWSQAGMIKNTNEMPSCCLLRIHVHQFAPVYFWGPTPDNRSLARTRMARSLFEKNESQFEVLLHPAMLKVTNVRTRDLDALRKHAPEYFKHLKDSVLSRVTIYDCVVEPIRLEMVYCKTMHIAEQIAGSASLKGRVFLSATDMLPKAVAARIQMAAKRGDVVVVPVNSVTPTIDDVEGYDASDVLDAISEIYELLEALAEIHSEPDIDDLIELDDKVMSLHVDFPFITRHMQPLKQYIQRHNGSLYEAFMQDRDRVELLLDDLRQAVQQPMRRTSGPPNSPVLERNVAMCAVRAAAIEHAKMTFVKGFAPMLNNACAQKKVVGVSLVPCTPTGFVLGKENDGIYRGKYNFFGGKIDDKIVNTKPSSSDVASVMFEEVYEEMGIVLDVKKLKNAMLGIVHVPYKDSVSLIILIHMKDVDPQAWKTMMATRRGRCEHKFYEMSDVRAFPWVMTSIHRTMVSTYVLNANQALLEVMRSVKKWPVPATMDMFHTVRIDEFGKPTIVSPTLRTPSPKSTTASRNTKTKRIRNVNSAHTQTKYNRIN
jgi:hypothetical protein